MPRKNAASKAFGDEEAVALIDQLYSKTGDLQNNILGLYSSMAAGTSATAKWRMQSMIQTRQSLKS